MRKVNDFLPNITPSSEVLLFNSDFECVEHYPFRHSELVGRLFADIQESLYQTQLPEADYCYFRFHSPEQGHYTVTVKFLPRYIMIINSKILFPQNEQDASNGD